MKFTQNLRFIFLLLLNLMSNILNELDNIKSEIQCLIIENNDLKEEIKRLNIEIQYYKSAAEKNTFKYQDNKICNECKDEYDDEDEKFEDVEISSDEDDDEKLKRFLQDSHGSECDECDECD